MSHALARLSLPILVLSVYGCGAILHGSRQNVVAESTPPGATVTGAGGGVYTTPATLSLERKSPHTLVFSLDGYRQGQFAVQNSIMAGVVVLDVLFTGFIGVIVDAVTGSWYKLVPETATVTLSRVDPSGPGPETVFVTVRLDSSTARTTSVTVESTHPGVLVRAIRGR